MRSIIEFRVSRERDVLVQHPRGRQIGAVGDIVSDPRPRIALRQHDMARHGIGGVMREQLRQIGGRVLELHDERVVVRRARAERGRRQRAVADRLRVPEDPEIVGIRRGRLGIEQALPREDEILCGDGMPVGPHRFAQMEGPGHAVFRNVPALSRAGNRPRRRVERGEPHQYVAENVRLRRRIDKRRIEALRLASIATVKNG